MAKFFACELLLWRPQLQSSPRAGALLLGLLISMRTIIRGCPFKGLKCRGVTGRAKALSEIHERLVFRSKRKMSVSILEQTNSEQQPLLRIAQCRQRISKLLAIVAAQCEFSAILQLDRIIAVRQWTKFT